MSTAFFKSSFSGGNKTCVEVGHRGGTMLIRDSKYVGDPADQPVVPVASADWQAVLDLVLSGDSGEVGGMVLSLARDGGASIAAGEIALEYDAAEWDAFAKGVADGQFDRRS